jgi:tetratricopeptide (TPR) repeat protein
MTATRHTLHDRYGLALSTRSATAVEAYVEGADQLLARGADAINRLRAAVQADDGFALAHADLALACRASGLVPEAVASMKQAVNLAAGLPNREFRHVAFVERMVTGDGVGAMGLLREQMAEHPRDAVVLSQLQFVVFAEGRNDHREQTASFADTLAPAYGDDWWFASFASMAYQEIDQFERARRLAEASLAAYPSNGNAAHPLAHVFYETDDHASGVGFLADWLRTYDRDAPYFPHLSWHQALSELAAGHYERAVALYDDAISPEVARTRLSFMDAASLLWRLDVYGCGGATALPWDAVRDLGVYFFPRPMMPFADAMMALACAGARDDAAVRRLTDGLRAQAATGHPIAGTVVLPLVEGVAAFGRGEYAEAARILDGIADEVVRIGGSNAQREVLEDTLVEAHLRAGSFERAEALIRRRLDRRPSTRNELWLGRARAGLGAAADAERHLETARARWLASGADTPELATLDRTLELMRGAGS